MIKKKTNFISWEELQKKYFTPKQIKDAEEWAKQEMKKMKATK